MIRTLITAMTLVFFAFTSSVYAGAKNEGITCLSKNVSSPYLYDKNGRDVKGNQVVGKSYTSDSGFTGQCMGRCGGACGWGAPSSWAKDCLDHDICIVDQDGSNGLSGDPNCGNEFNQAADDYAFGVLRGCSG